MLFSYRKGWFVYTPVMFFGILGIAALYRVNRQAFWSVLIYMSAMIYVMSSWWSWWFGGGFGSRSMVDTYGVMAIPIAGLVYTIANNPRKYLSYAAVVVLALLLGLQWMQTAQYNKSSIHYVAMDKDAYWHKYFKIRHRGVWPYLSDPDHQLARMGIYYYYDWSADYDAFRELGEQKGKQHISEELSESPKMMRSVHRHARRNDLRDEEALQMVVDRVYEMKTARENLK
ncbi:hypothetical protein ACFLT1_07640, partial [Bacteroidota bacterium]